MDHKELGRESVNWINIFRYGLQENAVIYTAMKFEDQYNLENFFNKLSNYRHLLKVGP
jgi:hypothetical protein